MIELIMTLYMMEQNFLAPTLNLEEIDPPLRFVAPHTGGRITSYNVCYTKLLRARPA